MPQKRNPENKGFPPRWRALHGAIYYRVPKGLEYQWDNKRLFRLGKTPSEAYKTWAARLEGQIKSDTIGQLLDRYTLEVIPTKEPTTQRSNIFELKQLRNAFSDQLLTDLQPKDVYAFVDARSAKVSARREVALLSHAFTKAVEWGYINRHPFKGEIRLKGEKPRSRYVEDWEIVECLGLPPVRKSGSVLAIQAYIRLKLITGLRRGDLLRLRITDCDSDGIHVQPNKTRKATGKSIIYNWSDNLREAFDMAKAARPVDISPWLFCNSQGKSYICENTGDASGWNSMWGRFFDRVLVETKVTERFTEHDLRAKCASDAETLEHARQLLAHADSKITQRVYRRKPERVKPAK
jgi:integrase